MSCLKTSPPDCSTNPSCPDKFGCIPGICPDFQIKRNDTKPPFKVSVTDEDGEPLDLTGLVLEANMWANGKLKTDLTTDTTAISLADNIGFYQVLPGDVIVVDQIRTPEHMLVTGFDEANSLIFVDRAYQDTVAQTAKKGTKVRIFRFMNAPVTTEMVYDNLLQVDGTTKCNQLIESFLVYEWTANDTCVPGCFSLEFKLLKMQTGPVVVPSVIPQCFSGIGVEWVRRYPVCGQYIIKVCPSPTAEI